MYNTTSFENSYAMSLLTKLLPYGAIVIIFVLLVNCIGAYWHKKYKEFWVNIVTGFVLVVLVLNPILFLKIGGFIVESTENVVSTILEKEKITNTSNKNILEQLEKDKGGKWIEQ